MRRASTNVRWNRIAELNVIVVSLVALGLFALPAGASSSSTSDSAAVHHADVGGVGSGALDVVSCSSATFCMAAGQGFSVLPQVVKTCDTVTIFNGASWTAPVVVDAERSIVTISCISASFCMAGDTDGGVRIFDGRSWSSRTAVAPAGALTSISCSLKTMCVAVARDNAFMFNGLSWTKVTLDTGTLTSVSCPNPAFCMAVSQSGMVDSFDGSVWTPTTLPGSPSLTGVDCPTRQECVAADFAGGAATYRDGTWSSTANVDPWPLERVSCGPNGLTCVAINDQNNVFSLANHHWSDIGLPSTTGRYGGVSCWAARSCMAVDNVGEAATYNNGSWSMPLEVDPSSTFTGVSCPQTTFCAAVDRAGRVSYFDGRRWTPPAQISQNPLIGVSCPTVTFCAAIGTQDDDAEGFILVYQSGRWGGGASDNFTYLTSVSCADETLCVAVDTQSRAYVYDGRTWTPEVVGNGETSFEAVSCASPAFCVATGNSFALYKHGRWIQGRNGPVLDAVSCVSETFCVGEDIAGIAYMFNGQRWIQSANLNSAVLTSYQVSCPSTTSCIVSDRQGRTYAFNGTSWSGPSQLPRYGALLTQSCPTPSFCATGYGDGILAWGSTNP